MSIPVGCRNMTAPSRSRMGCIAKSTRRSLPSATQYGSSSRKACPDSGLIRREANPRLGLFRTTPPRRVPERPVEDLRPRISAPIDRKVVRFPQVARKVDDTRENTGLIEDSLEFGACRREIPTKVACRALSAWRSVMSRLTSRTRSSPINCIRLSTMTSRPSLQVWCNSPDQYRESRRRERNAAKSRGNLV